MKRDDFEAANWQRVIKKEARRNVSQTAIRDGLLYRTNPVNRPCVWAFLCSLSASNAPSFSLFKGRVLREVTGQLAKDLPRTSLCFLDARGQLRKLTPAQALITSAVLLAYARLDPDIGYVQGMNFIAGAIVCAVIQSISHGAELPLIDGIECATTLCFSVFEHIFRAGNWRALYERKFAKLRELLDTLSRRMQGRGLGFVEAVLTAEGFDLVQVFSGYFFAFLLNKVPKEFSARVLDFFLVEREQLVLRILVLAMERQRDVLEALIKNPVALVNFLSNELLKNLIKNEQDFAGLLCG